jgi:hypothetical protein
VTVPPPGNRLPPDSPNPIRDGHRKALQAMLTPEFAAIVKAFERIPEIGGTYFRLVEKGFQPVDLDAASGKPLIGVGESFRPGTTLAQIEAELPERVADLLRKRRDVAASPEKSIEAAVIRRALADSLRLDGFGANLRFLAGQWRMALGARGEILDLLAVDVETAGLVVIELKAERDQSAVTQASHYAEILRRHDPTTRPFFQRLGAAMAQLYGCADVPKAFKRGLVTAIAAWPGTERDTYEIVRCP